MLLAIATTLLAGFPDQTRGKDLGIPPIEVRVSAEKGSAVSPDWTKSLDGSTAEWFKANRHEWNKLPFDSYTVDLTFPNQWPTKDQVYGAPFRRGIFLRILVEGKGSTPLSRKESYVWGDGTWIVGDFHTRRYVRLEQGVASYINISMRQFFGWAPKQLERARFRVGNGHT